jgi:hypothetical protein
MNTFKKYLQESVKQYDFRVKIAGDISEDMGTKLESALNKWKVSSFKKVGQTPVQEFPLDFPKLKNEEVSIYTVTVDYPTTQNELTEYLSSNLNLAKERFVVRVPGEPSEEYQQPGEKRTEALLTDSEYKEAPNANFDDYYGDKYNTGFVKELNDILKLQRKARGEVIPESTPDDIIKNPGQTLNDIPQNNVSPLKQTDYNPLRK